MPHCRLFYVAVAFPMTQTQSTSYHLKGWVDPTNDIKLNKYQINMSFLYFHELRILSGMNILSPYQIDIVKRCGFYNMEIILIWCWYLFCLLIVVLEDGNNIYLIWYFLYILKKLFKKIYLSYPSIQLSSLLFHAQLEMNAILHIIKMIPIVY